MRPIPLALAFCAFTVAAEAADDPLAQAHQGKFQCYLQDAARKTCRAIARYDFGADGKIANPALVLVQAQPVMVMAVTSEVEEKGAAVCGIARSEDIDQARLAVADRTMTPEETVVMKSQIKTAMAARLGKEICTTYVAQGDQLKAQVTVNGAPAPELTAQVLWVSPEDGYIVAP